MWRRKDGEGGDMALTVDPLEFLSNFPKKNYERPAPQLGVFKPVKDESIFIIMPVRVRDNYCFLVLVIKEASDC